MSGSACGRGRWLTAVCVLALSTGLAGSTAAAPESGSILDALISGNVSLNAHYRYEHAKADGAKASNANTLRTRLGYGSRPYYGLSFYLFSEVRARQRRRLQP